MGHFLYFLITRSEPLNLGWFFYGSGQSLDNTPLWLVNTLLWKPWHIEIDDKKTWFTGWPWWFSIATVAWHCKTSPIQCLFGIILQGDSYCGMNIEVELLNLLAGVRIYTYIYIYITYNLIRYYMHIIDVSHHTPSKSTFPFNHWLLVSTHPKTIYVQYYSQLISAE